MAACLLASGAGGTRRVKSGLQNAEREDRDLGVINPDGTAFGNKIKELTDAEKHQGWRIIVCLTCGGAGFSQRLSNHLKLQPVENALALIC